MRLTKNKQNTSENLDKESISLRLPLSQYEKAIRHIDLTNPTNGTLLRIMITVLAEPSLPDNQMHKLDKNFTYK